MIQPYEHQKAYLYKVNHFGKWHDLLNQKGLDIFAYYIVTLKHKTIK